MVYPVFPNSPQPANYQRQANWPSEDSYYENGNAQFSTQFVRPLYSYTLTYENAQDARREQLEDFWNDRKGHTLPWFFTDPKTEHHFSNSAATGFFVTSKQGRFYTAVDCWRVIPQSGGFTLYSALSGALTQGVHYSFSQDNGFFNVFTASINSNDTYGWSGRYFRKVHFDNRFQPRSRLWGNYNFSIDFNEVLP